MLIRKKQAWSFHLNRLLDPLFSSVRSLSLILHCHPITNLRTPHIHSQLVKYIHIYIYIEIPSLSTLYSLFYSILLYYSNLILMVVELGFRSDTRKWSLIRSMIQLLISFSVSMFPVGLGFNGGHSGESRRWKPRERRSEPGVQCSRTGQVPPHRKHK